MKFNVKWFALLLASGIGAASIVGPIVLPPRPVHAQTTTLPNFTPANPLTGAELFWGDQPGNTVPPTGPTVRISAAQILSYIQANGGGGGGSSGGVSTFNGRAGNVLLTSSDVDNALGFAPISSISAILGQPNIWTGLQTFNGGVAINYKTFNSSTTLPTSINAACGDVSGGVITLTMPPNPIPNGFALAIKDCTRQAATHNLTIAANGGQTIEGATSVVINANGQSITPIWNLAKSNWDLF